LGFSSGNITFDFSIFTIVDLRIAVHPVGFLAGTTGTNLYPGYTKIILATKPGLQIAWSADQ
jgi:hypothetical protein